MQNRTLPGDFDNDSNDKVAHPNFRLFGTCTCHGTPANARHQPSIRSANAPFLNRWFKRVHVLPFPSEELLKIGREKFGGVPPVVITRCLDIYGSLVDEKNTNLVRISDRNASVRDFFKLLARIDTTISFEPSQVDGTVDYVTESQKVLCACEALDVFAAASPTDQARVVFAINVIAPIFGIPPNDLVIRITSDHPALDNSIYDYITVGRVRIPRSVNDTRGSATPPDQGNFVSTPHSLRLMETVSACVVQREPVLLVGETGCGKTTVLQKLANFAGRELIVQNLSLQTDSTDLLGGYRPLEMKYVARPLYENFLDIFCGDFSKSQNEPFLSSMGAAFQKKQFKKLSKMIRGAAKMGLDKVKANDSNNPDSQSVLKWEKFSLAAEKFERQRSAAESGLAFTFTEGVLVRAIKTGAWMLLDEINLASSETLQRLFGLLDGVDGTVTITERGDLDAVVRHPDFRLFAAMNPATDHGKKDLPLSMRSRFTEIYVGELTNPPELRQVSSSYLTPFIMISSGDSIPNPETSPIHKSIDTYLNCRKLADETLTDGGGQKPRYTLRTLCRALSASCSLLKAKFSLRRAIFEGFQLAFECQLDPLSQEVLQAYLFSSLGEKLATNEIDFPAPRPSKASETSHILLKPFWIEVGPNAPKDWAEKDQTTGITKFVLTKTAKKHLRSLARSIACGPWPLLLEGPTSAGKTTLVEYLAARTGHRCVRINNHEHTDIQEYVGSYVSSSSGALVFREGILVEALRKGYWIILDELNLAPSEVLEALNRLLDDNRELYISETQEYIKPHPFFRLFATQNPSGAYGGRKPLSRAFRNRFVEIHMGDIPNNEMVMILEHRCGCPPSHAKLLVKVLTSLQQRRSKQNVFQVRENPPLIGCYATF